MNVDRQLYRSAHRLREIDVVVPPAPIARPSGPRILPTLAAGLTAVVAALTIGTVLAATTNGAGVAAPAATTAAPGPAASSASSPAPMSAVAEVDLIQSLAEVRAVELETEAAVPPSVS